MRVFLNIAVGLLAASQAQAGGSEGRMDYWEISSDERRLDWLSAPLASPRLGLPSLTLECPRAGALKVGATGIEYGPLSGGPPIGTPMLLELTGSTGKLDAFEAPVLAWRIRADARSPQTAYFAPSYRLRQISDAKSITVRFGEDVLTAPVPDHRLWRRFTSSCAAL